MWKDHEDHKIPKGTFDTGAMLLREIHNVSPEESWEQFIKQKGIKRNCHPLQVAECQLILLKTSIHLFIMCRQFLS